MANLVGAGFLTLPYCIAQSGIIPGVMWLIFTCLLNSFSVMGITKCCMMSGKYTYKDVGEAALGPGITRFLNTVMAVYTLGSCVSFVRLLGNLVPTLINIIGSENAERDEFSNQWVIVPIIAVLVLYPLSLMRDLSSLKFTTTVSTVCIFYTALMIVVKAGLAPEPKPEVELVQHGAGVVIAFPILTVAFTLHYNVPKYFMELSNRSMARMGIATALSFSIVFVCYIATALGGYLTFGAATQSDVLSKNYDPNDTAVIIAKVGLTLILIGCYPLAFNSFRNSVTALLPDRWANAIRNGVGPKERKRNGSACALHDNLLSETSSQTVDDVQQTEAEDAPLVVQNKAKPLSIQPANETTPSNTHLSMIGRSVCSFLAMARNDWPHALLTKLLVSTTIGIGLGVSNIADILTYKGSIGGSMIVYIFPALMYFALVQRRKHAPAKPPRRDGSVNSSDSDDDMANPDAMLGELRWTWSDLYKTRHGLIVIVASVLGLTMLLCGVVTTALHSGSE